MYFHYTEIYNQFIYEVYAYTKEIMSTRMEPMLEGFLKCVYNLIKCHSKHFLYLAHSLRVCQFFSYQFLR